MEVAVEGTTAVLVWCVESTDTLDVVKFVVDCADLVNDCIDCMYDEDLQVGGNKWCNVMFKVE